MSQKFYNLTGLKIQQIKFLKQIYFTLCVEMILQGGSKTFGPPCNRHEAVCSSSQIIATILHTLLGYLN